ncbi:MAG: TerD family protein [Deltaproteobacteria bacterium]|jgi:stress response protein SCP2|nr:TerD family protein [Deltaproteobacteria bacterium]
MIKGQRIKIREITADPSFDVGITMHLSGPGEIGCVCFCLDASGALADSRWLIFEENATSPEAAVKFMGTSRGDGHDYEVTLGNVPAEVDKIVFVAFVNGPGAMNQLTYGHLRVKAGDRELSRYVLSGHDFGQEKAVMLAEIYRKGGEWRLYLNGQGFAEGIEGVFRHFRAGNLWDALADRERRDQASRGHEIVLTPEQADAILAIINRSASQEDASWPSQDGGLDDDPGRELDEDLPLPRSDKPPTLH